MPANKNQLQSSLQKPYDRILFSRDVLSQVFGSGFILSNSLIPATISPNKTESVVIDKVWIFGKIHLDDETEVSCYEVLLQSKVNIEQSKVAIQQYVRKMLVSGQAALICFITPSNRNVWRLTLVAKDSVITGQDIKEKTTNAKRYTYLLGPSESCKTAAERFETLSIEKEISTESLVNAFSVEKLSKSFFDEYTLHYQKFCDYLQTSNYRKSVFKISFPANASKEEIEKASKPIRDFVKKFLGRIVFLYFVQKKGWMGATNKEYNDGAQDFLKQLFNQSGGDDTFYCNWLSVLFFDTLNNNNRNSDDFLMPDGRTVKVPFLNGGLFDKEEFDDNILVFPSNLFYNHEYEDIILSSKNKNHGRGFLDFLDSFNFTIYEDSPDEQYIAVDPEMLGHIFENLLEDNKDKGAFYTPKEIVHYMCQESLIEYLTTWFEKKGYEITGYLGFDKPNQPRLFSKNENSKGQMIFEIPMQSEEKKIDRLMIEKLLKRQLDDEDINLVVSYASEFHIALDSVKICDPAIGSGAFPMGLLQDIFTAKQTLWYFEKGKLDDFPASEVKLNIIQNSIYGVDIEKGAVDIARLRFWLSLVVDEEKPKALPNLDYKIVVGNSLISKFDDETVEIDWNIKIFTSSTEKFVKEIQRLLPEIANKQKKYFDPKSKNKKKLQTEIRNLKIELLINQLFFNKVLYESKTEIKSGYFLTEKEKKHNLQRKMQIAGFDKLISKLKILLKNQEEPFQHFDWKLDFPEVLNPNLVNENNGFDIVIGNPPYVRQERLGQEYKQILKNRFPVIANGTADLYVYFFGIGLELIKPKGVLYYITLNKYLKTKYGLELRNLLARKYDVDTIIDFFELPVFEASTDASITKIIATSGNRETKYYPVKTLDNLNLFEFTSGNYQKVIKDATEWKFVDNKQESIIEKIYANTISLNELSNNNIFRGITTGLNEAFVLNNDIASILLKSESKPIVRLYAHSTDIKQWKLKNENRYFLATGYDLDLKNLYPTSYQYLLQYESKLKKREDKGKNWWNLRACKYYNYFEEPKIIYIHTAKKHEFYFDTEGRFINNSCYMIISDSQFLFCFLNSSLFEWFKKIKFVAYGDAEESGRVKLDYNKMVTIPIKKVSKSIEKLFGNLTKGVKTKKLQGQDTTDLEQQIDNLVYRLYELTYDEVKVIDPEFPLSKEEYEKIEIE